MSDTLFVMREHRTLYGLWAESVREVQADASITPLPKKLPCFEGISNYKGNVLPVLSLADISGRNEQEKNREKVMILVQTNQGLIGLTVEEALHVTENVQDKMAYDNIMLDNGILQISEIIRQEEPIFVLDMEKILEEINRS